MRYDDEICSRKKDRVAGKRIKRFISRFEYRSLLIQTAKKNVNVVKKLHIVDLQKMGLWYYPQQIQGLNLKRICCKD